jgi:formate dehydrogenase subunit gamma
LRYHRAFPKQGGGFIRSKHPPAHRFNAGEKLVFWLALSAGAVVSASGYLLLFPFYATSITGMQIANVFEAMWTGEVDFNWAKEHHNLWLEEELAKGESVDHAPHLSSSPAE